MHPQSAEASPEEDRDESTPRELRRESRRAQFMVDATQAVAGALNLGRVVQVGAHTAVPELGDWAQVAVSTGGGALMATSTGRRIQSPADAVGEDVTATLRRWVHTIDDLDALVVADDARAECQTWLPAEVLSVVLRARGAPAGRLTVVRRDGFDDDGDVALVEEYGERLAAAVDAARLYGELDARTRILQASLIPGALPTASGLSFAAHFEAAAGDIGGDFYDVHGSDGDWTITVGDVTGKGVHAAVRTGQTRHALRTAALVDRSPAAMLTLVNRVLVEESDGRFVTIACCRLRTSGEGMWLEAASAGHPAPLVLRSDGTVDVVPARGTLAGAFLDCAYEAVTVALHPGDTVVLYTDGLSEARSSSGEMFGSERVRSLLADCVGIEAQAVVEYLAQMAHDHHGRSPADDTAILAAQVLAP